VHNNLPLLLHLQDTASHFVPNDHLRSYFSVESHLFDPLLLASEELIGVILETEAFEKHHLESFQTLHSLGKKMVLILLCAGGKEEYIRSVALMTQCVTFPLVENKSDADSLCETVLPMLREHVDALRYQEALKMRSHRSGSVDSLNVVAHQWRQPLNLISMEAINLSIQSTLEPSVPSSSIQKSTQMISEQSQRMAEILKSVLNMGKTHRGKEPFSINAMMERVKLFFADQLQLDRIDCRMIGLEEDKFLHGYSTDFEEVLVNLIANAKDAFKTMALDYPKSITLEVKSNEASVQFILKDNAGGVPESIREKIFEPHFSTKGQGEGFGIGLHIARLIVTQEFKGTLSLNVSGNETTFTITIPRHDTSQLKFIYS